MSKEKEKETDMSFQGWYSRFLCGNCEEVFDIEDDVTNGEEVICDACGEEGTVSGR